MKSNGWGEKITGDKVVPSSSAFVVALIALLLGAGLGVAIPFIVPLVFPGVNIGKLGTSLASFGLLFWAIIICVIALAVIILQRYDELAVTIVIAIDLCVDWYLGVFIISQVLAFALLMIFFAARSPRYTWAQPQALWLWVPFLVLAIFPAIRGALTARDLLLYYPNVVFGAFIMFWLGTVIARNPASIRLFFQILSVFAVLIALHTIVQATTGVTLLGSSRVNDYITSQSNYDLSVASDVARTGSFFIQPNFTGIFFAMMIFIPLGLFVETPSVLGKILYLAEVIIMLPALLFTYSGGALIAAGVGTIVFVAFVGHTRYRIQIPFFITGAALVILIAFPSQVNLLFQHLSDPQELALRNAIWQTGLQVIRAFPLTGVGLGHQAYLLKAEPYRVAAQPIPYDHPHNSYIEWGAMAGLPVLLVFLALLTFVLWQALRNWIRADARTRSLLGAGIAAIISLSVSSWSNQGWTLPPLAAPGWLILGAISSSLLLRGQNKGMQQEHSDGTVKPSR